MNQGLTILVFDSGLGGLTVFREIAQARPDAAYVYVADDAFFPYARRSEEQLVGRVVPLMQELIATHAPDSAGRQAGLRGVALTIGVGARH